MSDMQVLFYTAGRAMLWVVVLSSFVSMYEYFRAFYRTVMERERFERETKQASAAN
jgi:hypothetical protein